MDNPFKNLLGSFGAQKSVSAIGIDIGSSSVKVVQLKKKGGKALLETYGEIALGPYAGIEAGRATQLPSDKLSEVIKDLLKESNTTTKSGGLSISIGSSFIVFMKLPTSDETELKEMIPLEARKYIPVPISEVTLDWWVIPKDESTLSEFQNGKDVQKETGSEVLLVVIHNDALTKNKEIQKNVGLENTFSEVEIFSSLRSSIDPSLSPQMIMDFGAGSTKVFVVERGILKASHVINKGAQDITLSLSKSMNISYEEAEKLKRSEGIMPSVSGVNVSGISAITIDYIFAEVGRFVFGYEKKYGKKISKTVLTGGGALLKGIKERAESALGVPVSVADPFSRVEYPAFLEEVLKNAGPEFAVSIGLAIRELQGS